jgi:hypothetical protein
MHAVSSRKLVGAPGCKGSKAQPVQVRLRARAVNAQPQPQSLRLIAVPSHIASGPMK